MKPHGRTLVLVLLSFFKDSGCYVGGQLLTRELQQQWADTGFRATDFEQALRRGQQWGLFELLDSQWGPITRLLADQVPTLTGTAQKSAAALLIERTRDHWTILNARKRERRGRNLHTRADDPSGEGVLQDDGVGPVRSG